MTITPHLFEAFLKCPTKCWLRSVRETPAGNAYAEWVQTQSESYRAAAAKWMAAGVAADECVVAPAVENLRTAKWRLAVDVTVRTPALISPQPRSGRGNEVQTSLTEINQSLLTSAATIAEARLHAVERMPSEGRGKAARFIPIRFIFRNKLTKDDKLLLAFDAFVLSETLGRDVSLGKIIHGDLGSCARESAANSEDCTPDQQLQPRVLKVKTSALAGEVRKRLEKIAALLASPTPPDLVLNRHCAECEFRDRCRQKAIETDDLSLLAGMSAKERQKLRSEGIFTVTQLSYTFRPRRRPRRQRDKREKYHHSLKALAIREKKIHIVGSPELKIEGTPVYLDVEGLPDRDFYYLIGLRIGNGDSAVQHSLWADTVADEAKIWCEFLAILETVEQPVLIHYGRYETVFLKQMCELHGRPLESSTPAKAIGSSVNIVSTLFAQIYFPGWSNSLKDTAGWLGYRWSAPNATGTQSIIWRHRWDESHEPTDKSELLKYNTQDCDALEMVTTVVQRLHLPDAGGTNEGNQRPAVVSTDSLIELPWLFRRFASPIGELELINKAAHWNYQRDRIYVRTNDRIRRARHQQKCRRKFLKPNKVVVVETPLRCPKCDRSMKRWPTSTSILYDVHFSSGGVKRWIVQYKYRRAGCEFCHVWFGRPDEFRPHSKYGRNLLALIAFQVAGLCMPQRTILESLNSLLGFRLSQCTVNNLKASVARSYRDTKERVLRHILTGGLIQADETRISVKGKIGYVWVLASLDSVIYIHTETREGERIQAILSEFKGVLVSDFYAVYDSIACLQQKCLIHLLRDLNDEILNAPYDEDLKQLITGFSQLLKPMIDTVDGHGLKSHFLRKHQRFVDRFYRRLSRTDTKREATAKIKQRLEKNRDKLFTFLNYNGVPWNNNNAEHAIKAFARLRRVIEGLSTPKGMEEYLTLLSVCQTCKYMGVDFLDFLRSGQKDIHAFAESRRRRKRPSPSSSPS